MIVFYISTSLSDEPVIEKMHFFLLFNTCLGSISILRVKYIFYFIYIKGISIILKGYPDERFIYILLKNKEFKQFERIFSDTKNSYFIGFWVIWILGFMIQNFIIRPLVIKYRLMQREHEIKFKAANKLLEETVEKNGDDDEHDALEPNYSKSKDEKIIDAKAKQFQEKIIKNYLEKNEKKEKVNEKLHNDKSIDSKNENIIINDGEIFIKNSHHQNGKNDTKSLNNIDAQTQNKAFNRALSVKENNNIVKQEDENYISKINNYINNSDLIGQDNQLQQG